MNHRVLFVMLLSVFGLARYTEASIILSLDYTHDTLIGTHATARAALEAAASDVSGAMSTWLTKISPGDNQIAGTSGVTTATFNWRYTYSQPGTGSSITINTPDVAVDEIRIFVGVRNMSGSTLGIGSPNGAGYSFTGSGFPSDWVAAVADAEMQVNTIHGRSGGPVMGSFSGNSTLGSATAIYDLAYGFSYGSIAFDVDSDNNGIQDDFAMLENYWHFDHTTPVMAGKNDFYSVAVHELLHTLGVGTAEAWHDLASGTTWSGVEAIALNGGSGVGLITTDGHIANNLMSRRLLDGVLQEVVMDSNIIEGTRKSLTWMDLAFLRDIGWETIIPEPGVSVVLLVGTAMAMARRGDQRP